MCGTLSPVEMVVGGELDTVEMGAARKGSPIETHADEELNTIEVVVDEEQNTVEMSAATRTNAIETTSDEPSSTAEMTTDKTLISHGKSAASFCYILFCYILSYTHNCIVLGFLSP